jgi:hypothetical protein
VLKVFKAQLVHLLTLRVLLLQQVIYLQAATFPVMRLLYKLMVTFISGAVHLGKAVVSLLAIQVHKAFKVYKVIKVFKDRRGLKAAKARKVHQVRKDHKVL